MRHHLHHVQPMINRRLNVRLPKLQMGTAIQRRQGPNMEGILRTAPTKADTGKRHNPVQCLHSMSQAPLHNTK